LPKLTGKQEAQTLLLKGGEVTRPPETEQLFPGLLVLVLAVKELASDGVGGQEHAGLGQDHKVHTGNLEEIFQLAGKRHAIPRGAHGAGCRLDRDVGVGWEQGHSGLDPACAPGHKLGRAAAKGIQRGHAKAPAQGRKLLL
jgi:hypothetical protein